MSLFLTLALFCIPAAAASATISITASAGTVVVGNQVTFFVDVSGSEKIGSWSIALKYDPAYLEYVSGADSGGGGSLLIVDSCDGQTKLSTIKIVFKTKKIGSASLSVESAQIVSFDTTKPMKASSPSRTVSIVAPPTYSGDNNLSSLSISPGELTPAFSAANTAYAAGVPFEVAKIDVSATAAHGAARVSISETELAVGENKIEVVVTAENGRTKTYTITVIRKESDLAGVTAEVGGKTLQVAYDPKDLTPPDGYTASTSLYREKKILTFASPKNTILIAYLIEGENGAWYLYDPGAESFSEMITLQGTEAPYVVLTPPETVEIPDGFALSEPVKVGERELSLYRSDITDQAGVYLVYAMAKDGTCGLYYFDLANSSFVAYFAAATSDPALDGEGGGAALVGSDVKESTDRMEILALALGLVAVLLFIAWLLTFVFLLKKKKSEAEMEKELSFARPIRDRDSGDSLDELRSIYGITDPQPTAPVPTVPVETAPPAPLAVPQEAEEAANPTPPPEPMDLSEAILSTEPSQDKEEATSEEESE